ncbi:ShlB/FhaC/HecB family hemolysin secretion/activation protein [Curvivirga sp.]|uniref:ShlB/FhaC/HecB family hemolysin secretion/activation protein n=1 Tax=Curvivirga sp. TaxID=2856848 RepID=UPI003B5AD3F2
MYILKNILPLNLVLSLFVTTSTFAQTVQQTPSSLLNELDKPDIPVDTPLKLEFKNKNQKQPYNADDQTILNIQKVIIDGNSVFTDTYLAKYFQTITKGPSTVKEINQLISELTADYRNKGYFLASISPVISNQNDTTTLSLRIVEGFIDEIILEPIKETILGGPDEERILSYARLITESHPLHIDDIERGLLLINDMPGVKVKSVIKPSPNTIGAANLHLLIEHEEFTGVLTTNNRGTKTLGRNRLHGLLSINSLTGTSNETQIHVSTIAPINSEGKLLHLGLTHKELIGDDGLSLTVNTSGLYSEEGGNLEQYEIIGTSRSTSVSIDYPVLRTRNENLYASAQLNYAKQETTLLDEPILEDRVWSIEASGKYELAGDGCLSRLTVGISKGLNIFDASNKNDQYLSRNKGRPDFLKTTASFSHDQLLSQQVVGSFKLATQISPHSLLSSQEFTLGGSQYGKAYQGSSLSGDQGLATAVEFKKNYSFNTDITLQPFTYIDGGRVWNHNDQEDGYLASTGVGLRLHYNTGAWWDISLNAPLTNKTLNDRSNDLHVFFSGGISF